MEFFDLPRPVHGPARIAFAFGELGLVLSDIDEALRAGLHGRYGPFCAPNGGGGSALQVDVRVDERDYFIEPRPGENNPILLACDGMRVRLLGYCASGWFDTSGGRGQLVLSRGPYEPDERSAENYIRAAVAWQAASLGGALVHAASAIHRGRGYLFYGESGAGKSTLASCDRRADIVSDDLSLVLPGDDGTLDLVGTPFRGTYQGGEPLVGRAPLAAGFRIVKDERAAICPVPRLKALAELVGNLPFVAEAFEARPDLFDNVERAFREIPLAHLHFRKDDSYWDAIERAGL